MWGDVNVLYKVLGKTIIFVSTYLSLLLIYFLATYSGIVEESIYLFLLLIPLSIFLSFVPLSTTISNRKTLKE